MYGLKIAKQIAGVSSLGLCTLIVQRDVSAQSRHSSCLLINTQVQVHFYLIGMRTWSLGMAGMITE